MKYQLDGLNWLYYRWYLKQSAILADEMGLGKTIQIIGFIAALVQSCNCFPFLLVVPNSTCANWRREIKQWAPSLRAVGASPQDTAGRLPNVTASRTAGGASRTNCASGWAPRRSWPAHVLRASDGSHYVAFSLADRGPVSRRPVVLYVRLSTRADGHARRRAGSS